MKKRNVYKVSLYRGLGLRKISEKEESNILCDPDMKCLGIFNIPHITIYVFEWHYKTAYQESRETFLLVRKEMKH